MKLIVESSKPARAAAAYIRMSVFVLERGIAFTDEFDAKIQITWFMQFFLTAKCRLQLAFLKPMMTTP